MLNSLLKQFQGNNLKANLIRGGLVSITIKILGLGFSLITSIILARSLGPEQYGIYSYVLAIVSILAIPAMFGLPSLIVRETAKSEVNKAWGSISGLWFWSNSIAASLSFAIALITAFVLLLNRKSLTDMQFMTFAWGILFIPLSSMAALRGASLRGLRKVIQGQLPEQVLKPAIFIIMLVGVGLTSTIHLNAQSAMMLNAMSAGVAFMFGAWLLRRARPEQINKVEKTFDRKAWFASVVPFAVLSGLSVVVTQTDIIMLGVLKTSTDVGIYKISSQGADLAALGIVASNMVTMPYMSRFASENNIEKLELIAQKSARISLLFSLFVALVFWTFGRELITLVFGVGYSSSYWPLLILIVGQIFHAGFGQGGTLLNMCGHERGTLVTLIFSALLNIILNFIFIPLWGISGAAFASLLSMLFRKVVIWIMVYMTYKFDSSALGFKFE